MLALGALICAALYSGAALYIALVDLPVRRSLDPAAALLGWATTYRRATVLQASLALIGGAMAVLAWWRYQSNGFWLAGGALLALNIPYTMAAIWQTNRRLADTAASEAAPLLAKWGGLHLIRVALGLVATGLIARGILP